MKLDQKIQELLNQKIEASKQSDFINQAVLNALQTIPSPQKIEKNSLFGNRHYTVYTDGGARGNPGPAGCGIVIFDYDNQKIQEIKHFIRHATNNEAEYTALLLGVKKVLEYLPQKVTFYLDSELIVKQIKGEYKVKKTELKTFFIQIQSLLQSLPQKEFIHIPREQNKLADKLANQAMDEKKALKTLI